MTEQEYMDATNLAKIRIAKEVLRDTIFLDENAQEVTSIITALARMAIRLQDKVKCE